MTKIVSLESKLSVVRLTIMICETFNTLLDPSCSAQLLSKAQRILRLDKGFAQKGYPDEIKKGLE